jgi:mannose-6-phosphate isomerase-like protein (cupin superfamily)
MTFEATKHVFGPGQGEVLKQPAPATGQITILVEPRMTGDTDFCTLIQTLDAGALVPVHHHDKAEQVLFFISGNGRLVVGGTEVEARHGLLRGSSPRRSTKPASSSSTTLKPHSCSSARRPTERTRR